MESQCMDPWSVGKYAKRSAIIHLNSDAQAQTVAVVGEADVKDITAVSADGLTITLEDAFVLLPPDTFSAWCRTPGRSFASSVRAGTGPTT